MTRRILNIGAKQPLIVNTGARQPLIDPKKVADALGADSVPSVVPSVPIVSTRSRWQHRKTKRLIVVDTGNEPLAPMYIGGSVITGRPGDRVRYHYTDRETRVMPVEIKLASFLKTFERAS